MPGTSCRPGGSALGGLRDARRGVVIGQRDGVEADGGGTAHDFGWGPGAVGS